MFNSVVAAKQSLALAGLADDGGHPQAQKKWYRRLSQRAGVCLILADHETLGVSILMIQRAIHENDPWSGQMAFPGGKHEADDAHITATALRELEEELAVEALHLKRVGRLSDILARPYRPMKKSMVVTPLVFEAQTTDLIWQANEEVADVLWLPLSHFKAENRQRMAWQKKGLEMDLPCYHYADKTIWGLSLMMIDELLASLS